MKMFGVVGLSGSGKTTLIVPVISELTRRGLRVSTIKHTHHGVDLDRPGKDTFRHRAAGAVETVLISSARWTVMHELRGAPEPTPQDIARRLDPVDLILVEGFKCSEFDKLEVFRPSLGHPPLFLNDPHIVAVASDAPTATGALPCLPLNDPAAITAFILRHCALAIEAV